jgi:GxxExxY protein
MRADIDPRLDGLTERIIGGAFAVSNGLGHGFLELVYRNALALELEARDYLFGRNSRFRSIIGRRRLGIVLPTWLSKAW